MRLLAVSALLLLAAMSTAQPAFAERTLLNVSYDPTRELYQAIDAAFVAQWHARTGETIKVMQSHGGSGAQARSVIQGLQADVVTLALSADIDAIAQTGKIKPDWAQRFPDRSTPFTSTIVFLVRKGNPKRIHDWGDLVRPDVSIVTPNPKTSGGARWNYLAAYAYALHRPGGSEQSARDFVGRLYHNASVLDSGARGSTTTFAQRDIGDVLIAWENEALLAQREFAGDGFELVVPSVSIKAEPPVAVVDEVVDRHNTRDLAGAYLQFLYSEAGQEIAAQNFYRPTLASVPAALTQRVPKLKLYTIDDLGGWSAAQKTHFANGGVFDQIYQPK